MFVSEYSEEYNSLRPESVLGRVHEEVVPARSLDTLSRALGIRPDVVKIDVEGAEWPVLKGLLREGLHGRARCWSKPTRAARARSAIGRQRCERGCGSGDTVCR